MNDSYSSINSNNSYNNNQNSNINNSFSSICNNSTQSSSNQSFNMNNNYYPANYSSYNNSMSYNSGYGYAPNMTGYNQNNNIRNNFNSSNIQDYYKNILSSAPIKRNENMNTNNANNNFNNFKLSKIEQSMGQYVIRKPQDIPNNYEENRNKDKKIIREFIEYCNNVEKQYSAINVSTFSIYMMEVLNLLENLNPYEIKNKISQYKDYASQIYIDMIGEKRAAIKNGTKLALLCLNLITKNDGKDKAGIYTALLNNNFEDLYNNFDKAFYMLDDNNKNLIKQAMAVIGAPIPTQSQKTKDDGYLLGDLKEDMLKIEKQYQNKLEMYKFLLFRNKKLLERSILLDHAIEKIEKRLTNSYNKLVDLSNKSMLSEAIVEKFNSGLKLILASLFLLEKGAKNNQNDNYYNDLINIIKSHEVDSFDYNDKDDEIDNFDLIFKNYRDQNLAKHLKNFMHKKSPF